MYFIFPNTISVLLIRIDIYSEYEKKYYLLQDCMSIDGRAHARRILDPNTVADPVSGARDHLLCRRSTRVVVVVRMLFLVFST